MEVFMEKIDRLKSIMNSDEGFNDIAIVSIMSKEENDLYFFSLNNLSIKYFSQSEAARDRFDEYKKPPNKVIYFIHDEFSATSVTIQSSIRQVTRPDLDAHLPQVIVLTSSIDPQYHIQLMKFGADDILILPQKDEIRDHQDNPIYEEWISKLYKAIFDANNRIILADKYHKTQQLNNFLWKHKFLENMSQNWETILNEVQELRDLVDLPKLECPIKLEDFIKDPILFQLVQNHMKGALPDNELIKAKNENELPKLLTFLETEFDVKIPKKEQFSLLIIEDEYPMMAGLIELFKPTYQVYSAENGREALAILDKNDIDGVFLDIGLPDISGTSLLKLFHKKDENIQITMLTAYSDKDLIIKSLQEGLAFDYVVKLPETAVLLEKAQQMTEKKYFLNAFNTLLSQGLSLKKRIDYLHQYAQKNLDNKAVISQEMILTFFPELENHFDISCLRASNKNVLSEYIQNILKQPGFDSFLIAKNKSE